MPRLSLSIALAGVAAALLTSPALAHVILRYPPTGLPLDFLDNLRTVDICGIHPNRDGEGAVWQIPAFNTSVTTIAVAGSTLDVSWDLHYAHNGGFRLELYDADLNKVHEWAPNNTWGCNVDATKQNVTIIIPPAPCPGCVLRFERQALEWGENYLFRSCALLDIVAASAAGSNAEAACNGCSGRGTCSAGTCKCNSSAATGFFYGKHCEYENECETDADCGANGKCVNIGDVSGPAKQCFCKAGFFGDVVTSPTGLQHHTCDRASTAFASLDPATVAWDTFGTGYQRSLTSSTDVFSGHLTPGEETVEFAFQGRTTSWVAMGMRSVGAAAVTAAATEGYTGAAAEATPEAGAETPAEPAPAEGAAETPATPATTPPAAPAAAEEGTGRRLRSRVPRILNGVAVRALAEAESASDYDSEAEKTPAAASEGAAPEGAAAEGEGTGSDSKPACPNFNIANLVVPGPLGSGAAVNGTKAAGYGAATAEAEAPAGAAETPAEPGAARRLSGHFDVPRMPLIQAETGTGRIHAIRRSLLNAAAAETPAEPAAGGAAVAESESPAAAESESPAAAESESPAAESEGSGATKNKQIDFANPSTVTSSGAKVGAHAGGVCDGAFTTPNSAHAMDNQDVVFGAAREIDGTQYFRVVDMFTPSRAKPQPDSVFGGTDDITDAWGAEVDGVTYIKYVRAIKTADTIADACISDDQTFRVIYAMGQEPGNFTHIPGSFLETIGSGKPYNTEFYKLDELKFHGGGIGSGSPRRGNLGGSTQVNLFKDDSADRSAGACTPSTLAPEYDCMISRLQGNSIIHYKTFAAGDAGAQIAAETPSETGWVALGFHPPGSPNMVGSTAVIATDSAQGGVGVFDMNAQNPTGLVEAKGATASAAGRRRLTQASTNVPFTITDASVERTAGKTILRFTRPYDADFTGGAPINALTAYSSAATNTLGPIHDGREPFQFSLSADGSVSSVTDPAIKNRRIHAILMIAGWGVLLPLGVAMANTLRTYGPVWFLLHRIIQTVGLILASAGFILALVKFESLNLDDSLHRNHRALGITVMVFGWIQPLNALIRPHPPKEGEEKPTLRLGWEILHKGLGYLSLILAVITIFLGLKIGETFPPFQDNDSWRSSYIGLLVAVCVIWALLLVNHFLRKRNLANNKNVEVDSGMMTHLGTGEQKGAPAS